MDISITFCNKWELLHFVIGRRSNFDKLKYLGKKKFDILYILRPDEEYIFFLNKKAQGALY